MGDRYGLRRQSTGRARRETADPDWTVLSAAYALVPVCLVIKLGEILPSGLDVERVIGWGRNPVICEPCFEGGMRQIGDRW
jgi:hypothetical protein